MRQPTTFFRADIEGLRAIAVILVVAAHFELPGFAGGFIGVDIFFVISGYLITSLLWRERQETGHIRLLRFYVNRLRRLLPALVVMLVVSSFAAWWFVPGSQHPVQSEAAAAAVLWASNLLFAFSSIDYFAEATSSNAFLHTWSLGVEEQFYLLWPLLLLLLAYRSQQYTKRLTWFLVVVASVSLLVCLQLAQSHPIQAFYLMPTRAWQFAAGALVWVASRHTPPTKAQARLASGIGMLLLLVGLVYIGETTVYPSWWALLPTGAASALLWSGRYSEKFGLTAVLSVGPMQALGRLSYTWYLWHWPVLVIGEHLAPIKGDAVHTAVAIFLSLALAVMTHYGVENPIRFGRPAKYRDRWQLGIALTFMVLVSALMLRWSNSSHAQLEQKTDFFAQIKRDIPVIYNDGCDDYYHSDALKICRYGNLQASNTVVLLGDSIGAQWFNAIESTFDPQSWQVVVLTKSSCPMVDEPYFLTRIGREYTECSTWRNRAIAWLQTQRVHHLFIGGSANRNFSPQQWMDGTRRILEQLATHAEHVHLMEPTPALTFDGPDCLKARGLENCLSPAANPKLTVASQALQHSLREFSNVHWLKTMEWVCPRGQCHAMRTIDGQDVAIFRDSQHITASFAAASASYFSWYLQKNTANISLVDSKMQP